MTVQEIARMVAGLSTDQRRELSCLVEEHDAAKKATSVFNAVLKNVEALEAETDVQVRSINHGHTQITFAVNDHLLKEDMLAAFKKRFDEAILEYQAGCEQNRQKVASLLPEEMSTWLAKQTDLYASSAVLAYKAAVVPVLDFAIEGLLLISITKAQLVYEGFGSLQTEMSEGETINFILDNFRKTWRGMLDAPQQGNPGEWKTLSKSERMRIIKLAMFEYTGRYYNANVEVKQEEIVNIINELRKFEKPLSASTFSRVLKNTDKEDWKQLVKAHHQAIQEAKEHLRSKP